MRLLIALVMLCGIGFGQSQPNNPLTNQRVLDLVRAGVSPDELSRLIATAPQVSFDLTPAGMDAMAKAGVSETVIKQMSAREQHYTAVSQPFPDQPANALPAAPAGAIQPADVVQPARSVSNREFRNRTDIFLGYSYLNVDFNGLIDRQSANGWESSVAFSPLRSFAIEADGAGYYRTDILGSGAEAHDYSFLTGPRLNFQSAFVHALVGVDNLSASYAGLSGSQTSFAAAFGGGLQSKLFARHFAIRTSADYILTRHNLVAQATQNNFRVSGGIVFVFGSGASAF